LLVGENQKNGISKLILVQHALQFLPGLNNTVTIIAVNDEDDTLGVLEVMSPQRSDLVLSTNIPYGELNVLVFDSLNVEAWKTRCQLFPGQIEACCVNGAIIPIVGMVVTISPSFSLYKIVVFPAASKPTIKILISFFPQSLSKSFENVRPMIASGLGDVKSSGVALA
jgi:hypothetical protein